jgi:hypothetical protein
MNHQRNDRIEFRSRNAAQVNSQGRKPLENGRSNLKPQRGDSSTQFLSPRWGSSSCANAHQGLAPLAIDFRPVGPRNRLRTAFTLFELMLALALSAALLGVIGTALNLYLVRVEASRNRVEEAQLARSILTMIADDIRATAIYQPQDLSAVEKMMANGTPFDVDSIDDARSDSSSGSGGASAGASLGGGSGSASSFSASGSSGASSMAGASSSSSSGGSMTSQDDLTTPLGVTGSLNELYVDVARLPRRDELFGTYTGYTNAAAPEQAGGMTMAGPATAAASMQKISELKTIRYFVRPGDPADASGLAGTTLDPALQARAGGLVRQEIPRPSLDFEQKYGGSGVLESGQRLIAPEVINIQFRYFSGQEVTDVWDMQEEKVLPMAVEVTIWVSAPKPSDSSDGNVPSMSALANSAREYRKTVFLPMAELSQAAASAGAGQASSMGTGTSSTTSSSSSSSTSGSGTGPGSSTGGGGFGTSQ